MGLGKLGFTLGSLITSSILVSVLLQVKATTTSEIESVPAFSYRVGAPNGPSNWGNLNSSWAVCGTGKSQSPINIVAQTSVDMASLGRLKQQYNPAPAKLRNKVYDFEVDWLGDAGAIVINGIAYKLVQSHWHIHSEHTFNGIRFNMELHMVHVNSGGGIAVVAILYSLGPPDPFLQKIMPYLQFVSEQGFDLGIVNPWDIKFIGHKYYRYNGSLTTPPCSQNVTWTLFKKVRTVGVRQIRALQNGVVDGNIGDARPSQPLNGRTVYSYCGDH